MAFVAHTPDDCPVFSSTVPQTLHLIVLYATWSYKLPINPNFPWAQLLISQYYYLDWIANFLFSKILVAWTGVL